MKPRDLALPALVHELAQDWPKGDESCPREFIERWHAAFGPPVSPVKIGEQSASWVSTFPQIRFRGMNEVQVMLVGGSSPSSEQLATARQSIQPGRTPILLVASALALATWQQILPTQAILILGLDDIAHLLSATEPSNALRKQFRSKISLGRLDPYDFQTPAQGNMFYGRENELRMLKDKETQSFAIAGPGRIGKTSLAQAYRRALVRDHDPRAQRVRFMDCLHMSATTSSKILVRFIAGEIDRGRKASQMIPEDFPAFLRFQRHHLGGPLELIIDEVDAVCHTDVFHMLAEAAKLQHCRLLLCGKANLLHTMLAGKSPIALRLGLIRPEPLSREEARHLFMLPLRDLEIQIEPAAVEMVMNLTGCLPHQLQYYASQFLETMTRQGGKAVTVSDVEIVRDGVISQQFLRSALNELDTVTRALALMILEALAPIISIPSLQQLAARHGLSLGAERAMESLISLHIHNFLALEKGEYRIATGSLVASAQRHGFLKADLKEVVGAWRLRPDLGR